MQRFRKTINIISTVVVILALLLAFLLVGVRLLGVQVYTVLSGSMEPKIHTGSIIYVVDVDPQTLQEKDVITFYLSGQTIATHRIIEVQGEGDSLQFRTKGDNNDGADTGAVPAESVIGKAVFSIPLLGYFITYVQQPPWLYIAVAVGAVLLLLMLLPELLFDDKKTGNTGKKEGSSHEEEN